MSASAAQDHLVAVLTNEAHAARGEAERSPMSRRTAPFHPDAQAVASAT
jgi:hypothetical protein